MVQGQHGSFTFKGESVEEAWEWIRVINSVMKEAGGGAVVVGGGEEEGGEGEGGGEGKREGGGAGV